MNRLIVFLSCIFTAVTGSAQQPTPQPEVPAELTPAEREEFQRWVAIGVGGLPHTLEGYRTLQKLNQVLKDPRNTDGISRMIGVGNDVKTLTDLPRRNGQKPTIAPFAIPHRQTDQHNSAELRKLQGDMFKDVVQQQSAAVEFRKSYFERNNDSVFLKEGYPGNQDILSTTHSEVGHMHPSDGSMHFTLSPSDAKEVIEKGWGELHGLYGQVFNGKDQLSHTYMMIYSPRAPEELAVARQILNAGIAYAKQNKTNAKKQ
jgi:hypothetical protein